MKTINNIFSSDERFPLYQPYGSNQTTIAFISLDLESGDVDAEYKMQGNTSVKNFNGSELHFVISSQSTTDEIKRLISEMTSALEIILNDSEVEWDGSNRVGKLGDKAQDAAESLNTYDYDCSEQQTFIIDDLGEWLQDTPVITTTLQDLAVETFNCDGDDGYYFSDNLNNIGAIESALLDIWAEDLYSGSDLGQKEALALVEAGTCDDSEYTDELADYAAAINITRTETDVDVYPDQTNITVTIELDNDHIYRVQTDGKGSHSPELGCFSWLNDSEEFDTDTDEFQKVITEAETIAKAELTELGVI